MRRRKFLRVRVGCGFADMMSRRKMAFSCKNCLLIAYVIPLLLLTVLVFIGTLVLGKNKSSTMNSLIKMVDYSVSRYNRYRDCL